jgi:hypothetical protein
MVAPIFTIDDDGAIQELQRVLASENLILFAGSGLSAQAYSDDGRHPPMWAQLLGEMASWCRDNALIDRAYEEEIRDLITRNYLLEAGEEFTDILTPPVLQRCLGEVLLYNLVKPREAHSLIAKLPFRGFITTNYDDLIEAAYYKEHGVALSKYYEHTSDGVLDLYRAKQNFVFKIHGDISEPSSLVLGRRAYDRAIYANPTYRARIETVFAMSSVLFFGYGGTDPDLEAITGRVANFDGTSKRHWLLTPADSCPPIRARRLWKDRGINVIRYESDATHSEVVRFLEKLAFLPPTRLRAPRPEEAGGLELRSRIESIDRVINR